MVVTALPAASATLVGMHSHRRTVDMHGAGAAQPGAAAILRARQLQIVADEPKQRRCRIAVELTFDAVDGE